MASSLNIRVIFGASFTRFFLNIKVIFGVRRPNGSFHRDPWGALLGPLSHTQGPYPWDPTPYQEDNDQHLRVKPAGSAYAPEELADEDSKTRAFFKDPEDWLAVRPNK